MPWSTGQREKDYRRNHNRRLPKAPQRNGLGTMRPLTLALAKLVMLPALASAAPMGSSLWERSGASFGVLGHAHNYSEEFSEPDILMYLGIAVSLVLLGGAFAGLTIALMGQDETYLQVIATSGEGSERKHAARVLNLLKKGKHWVLVTLLLGNVITNETLPIVLDRSLGGGWPAVLSSTILIVIFGEIVPQSVCVRYGLSIGSYMSPFVLALMWVMFPVAWPTAKLLDYLLGEDHGTMYKKAGLKTLVQLHKTLGTIPGERLMEDEVTIINSVLDLKEKPVGDIMTPMEDVFTMSADTVLDERMMDTILSQGYSRIPIYTPDNSRDFIGMLLVKILITYDPEDCKRVRDFSLATLPETSPYTSCLDIINFFQEGKSHMVLVSDYPGQNYGALGVVTLEDVIEELIGEEIIDESDVFVDVHKALRRMQPAPKIRYGRNLESQDYMSESEYDGREHDEDAPLLGENSKLGIPNGSSFLVRRRGSDTSNHTRDALNIRSSNPAEIVEHLRHLGPSNAANKPRATKFSSVKIKPGVSTIPEGQATTTVTDQVPESPVVLPTNKHLDIVVDDNPGLLENAGKDASGGVGAIAASYSGADATRTQRRLSNDIEAMTASQASRVASEHTKSPLQSAHSSYEEQRRGQRDWLRVPEKAEVGSDADEDQIGEMSGPSRDASKPRRRARSGSITETHVESGGGMRKVVLETTSSSSDLEESAKVPSPFSHSRENIEPQADETAEEDKAETAQAGSANGDAGKKRKKKGGKKKK
ncbi:Hypothetical protein R9X50_00132600 [Acrodontium crateriforme]|uniref:Uncharacterized protein n=1 Tax=Acrodontium crateriforme TaxID=150365 RepID=A0AAQ3M0K0_9PEZI|nr:Hypothetical protein R9X50_00132600 [Acrodontium crateriforme]